jgi:hypothetical protein
MRVLETEGEGCDAVFQAIRIAETVNMQAGDRFKSREKRTSELKLEAAALVVACDAVISTFPSDPLEIFDCPKHACDSRVRPERLIFRDTIYKTRSVSQFAW